MDARFRKLAWLLRVFLWCSCQDRMQPVHEAFKRFDRFSGGSFDGFEIAEDLTLRLRRAGAVIARMG